MHKEISQKSQWSLIAILSTGEEMVASMYQIWGAPRQQIHSAIQSIPVKKYNAHINVEICSTINSYKYLYKYVYKGPVMASVQVVSSQGDPVDNNTDTKIGPLVLGSIGMKSTRFHGHEICQISWWNLADFMKSGAFHA